MKEEVCNKIDSLISAIYELKISTIESEYIGLLDVIEKILDSASSIDWNTVLLRVQDEYSRKDYVALADTLLDEIKDKI